MPDVFITVRSPHTPSCCTSGGGGGGGLAGKSRTGNKNVNFQRQLPKFLQPYAHMLGQKKEDEDEPQVLMQQQLRSQQDDDEEEDKAAEEAGAQRRRRACDYRSYHHLCSMHCTVARLQQDVPTSSCINCKAA